MGCERQGGNPVMGIWGTSKQLRSLNILTLKGGWGMVVVGTTKHIFNKVQQPETNSQLITEVCVCVRVRCVCPMNEWACPLFHKNTHLVLNFGVSFSPEASWVLGVNVPYGTSGSSLQASRLSSLPGIQFWSECFTLHVANFASRHLGFYFSEALKSPSFRWLIAPRNPPSICLLQI